VVILVRNHVRAGYDTPLLPQEGQYCLWCRRIALAWPRPKTRTTLITCLLLSFVSIWVLYTVVQSTAVDCTMKKYEICFEIKNVVLPENYMFWTMCFQFFGVLFTDCLIVHSILITLFMIWEQCLILNTGKILLRAVFDFEHR